jgi:ABC-type branched-subunit amino acid transport system substrate-binding protein
MRRPRVSPGKVVRGRSRLCAVAAAAALAVVAAGCSSSASTAGTGASPAGSSSPAGGGASPAGSSTAGGGSSAYEVGSIIDLTGADATSGAAQQAGMEYFLSQLNASGGINGHQLKVTYCDAASTPQGAAQCAQQFAGLSTHLVISQSDDPVTRGALPHLTNDLVVAVDPVLLPKSGTNVFQAVSAGSVIAGALVSTVKSSGLNSIGVLYTTDTSGTAQLGAAEKAAKSAGISVVSQPQTAGVTDVTPQLLKLKSMGAQVIYLASIGANTAAAVSSYKTLGLTIPLVAGAAAVTNSFLKSLSNGIPANLYGVSQLIGDTSSLPSAQSQAWAQYRSAFTKYANQPVDTQTTSAIYVGCVVQAALASSPAFSVSAMEQHLETSAIPCLGVQEKYSIPGLNVVAGQPAAVTKAGATAADGWGPYQGKL